MYEKQTQPSTAVCDYIEFIIFSSQGQTVFTCSEGTLTTDERYDGRTTVVEPPEFSDVVSIAINVSSLRESDTGDYECHVTYSGDAGPLQQSSLQPPLPTLSSPRSSTDSTMNAVDNNKGDTAGLRFRLDVQGERLNSFYIIHSVSAKTKYTVIIKFPKLFSKYIPTLYLHIFKLCLRHMQLYYSIINLSQTEF